MLDPADPAAPATRGDNFRDNVERIDFVASGWSRDFDVRVGHKGTLADGPQTYSLVITNAAMPSGPGL